MTRNVIFTKWQTCIEYPLDENGYIVPDSQPIAEMEIRFNCKLRDIIPRLMVRLQETLEFAKKEDI